MSLEEAILEKVRSLSPAKQEEVLEFVDRLNQRPITRRVPYNDRSRERQWIEENRDKYVGQWVVVEGDRLIAADPDGRKAAAAARAAGIDSPFLIHVVPEDPFPFVPGWK